MSRVSKGKLAEATVELVSKALLGFEKYSETALTRDLRRIEQILESDSDVPKLSRQTLKDIAKVIYLQFFKITFVFVHSNVILCV